MTHPLADKVLASAPEIRRVTMENRAFLGRAVRFLAAAGIQQFIDVGAGLPTRGNVHEVAQDACPAARVAYVDHDPVVCAHARALLSGTANVEVIEADMHAPQAVLGHEGSAGELPVRAFEEAFQAISSYAAAGAIGVKPGRIRRPARRR